MIRSITVSLTLLLLGMATPPAAAQSLPSGAPDTVRVAPPTGQARADRSSIVAALDEVRRGGTVQFATGTYLVGEIIRVETPRITLLGHPDGTVLRGCDPEEYQAIEREFVEAQGRPSSWELAARCGMFELTGGEVTVRDLTFEYSRMGLLLGCCHTEPRFRLTPGGYTIERNVFRNSLNGVRPWTTEPSVIRDNEFINTFHAPVVPDTLESLAADRPYLWLEDLHSDTLLAWSEARTTATRDHFTDLPVYDTLVSEIRAARQAYRFVTRPGVRPPAQLTGPYAERFQGGRLWVRQPVERYERGEDEWETVLDLDSLSRAEGGRYVPASVDCLPPAYDRCLLHLARDGRSRIVDLREFDAGPEQFVANGFELREAVTSALWRDANSVYVTTKPMGWADRALVWQRGEPLDSAAVLYTADPGDRGLKFERRDGRLLLLHARHQHDIDYYLVHRGEDGAADEGGEKDERSVADEVVRLPVPSDARDVAFVDGRVVVQLRSGWKPAGEAFPSGSLIAIGLDELVAGSREFDLVMPSSRDLVVDEVWTTRSLVIVRALADLELRLFEFAYRDGHWERRRIDLPESGRVEIRNTSPESDVYYIAHEDFLTPRTVRIHGATGEIEIGGESRPAFSADPYVVRRHHATSADGTRIPYFVVHREDMPLDGGNPVILRGYGGNGISVLPGYLMPYGPTWLSRGGVYALANIRGGNEYGFEWHDAVRREKRQRAFDDFQAVARDLVDRRVTSPGRIGIEGASNGGILVGMSFIQRPELFGAVRAHNGVLELHRCSQLSGDPPVGERGDGQDPDDWAYMQHYSPFHNLRAGQPYPAVFMLANRADDVVHPCHSRKFAAKLEDLGYEDVFLYETDTGGHGTGYGPEEEAMIMTFFLRYLHPEYSIP